MTVAGFIVDQFIREMVHHLMSKQGTGNDEKRLKESQQYWDDLAQAKAAAHGFQIEFHVMDEAFPRFPGRQLM